MKYPKYLKLGYLVSKCALNLIAIAMAMATAIIIIMATVAIIAIIAAVNAAV
jgi:hypothetical protein